MALAPVRVLFRLDLAVTANDQHTTVESAHLNATARTWSRSGRFQRCPRLFNDVKRADIVKVTIVLDALVKTAENNDLLVPINGPMTRSGGRGALGLDLVPF